MAEGASELSRQMLPFLNKTIVTRQQRTSWYWKAVTNASQSIYRGLDLERVLDSALNQIVETFQAQVVVGIWKLDEAEQKLTVMVQRGLSEKSQAALRSLRLDCQSYICEAARARQVRYTRDTHKKRPSSEMDRTLTKDENLGSWATSPLLSGNRRHCFLSQSHFNETALG